MVAFILKVIIASCGLIGTTAVTFIAVRIHKWIDSYDNFRIETSRAVTITIPDQIKKMNDDVSETHNQMMVVFSDELRPLNNRVEKVELDVKNIKSHIKYRDNE